MEESASVAIATLRQGGSHEHRYCWGHGIGRFGAGQPGEEQWPRGDCPLQGVRHRRDHTRRPGRGSGRGRGYGRRHPEPEPERGGRHSVLYARRREPRQGATEARVRRYVVVSIISVDKIAAAETEPGTGFDGYYRAKFAHEQATLAFAPGPHVVRSSQFHDIARQAIG